MDDRLTRIAVVGSRDLLGWYYVLIDEYLGRVKPFRLVSGGARGVDRYAERVARKMGMETVVFPADWAKYGKSAGFVRNASIVENSDIIIAFWDGESRGTVDTIKKAKDADKPAIVVECRGNKVRYHIRNLDEGCPYDRFVESLNGIEERIWPKKKSKSSS